MFPIERLHPAAWGVDPWDLLGRGPFALSILCLLAAGLRRGWPWRAALLATGALVAGFSLGAALLPSVLGAAAGGVAAWLVAQRALGLRRPPLLALAACWTLLVAVGRVGCLLAGCCFGAPTGLPWGVRYGPGSAAFTLHRSLGWIGAGAPGSLAVHPIQLYEALGLLAWLPLLFRLRRRLRSEAALLCLTAAVDLGLRAAIDGRRAMINVWWAVAGGGLGLDALQLALLGGALLCAGAAVACERRARRSAPAGDWERAGAGLAQAGVAAPAAAAGPAVCWAVYLSLCAGGLATDAGQTPLLRAALLCALVLAAPALELPRLQGRPGAPGWSRAPSPAWAGPALALTLLLPLLLRLQASAGPSPLASGPGDDPLAGPAAPDPRRWLYEVDHRRGLLVRLGSALDPPEAVERVRLRLGLDELPAGEPAPPVAPTPGRAGSSGFFIAVGGSAGGGTQSVCLANCSKGCGGTYQTLDRRGGGGWLRAEAGIPAGADARVWLGGQAGYYRDVADLSGQVQGRDTLGEAFGQLWAEYEHDEVTLGVAVLLAQLSVDSPRTGGVAGLGGSSLVLPGGHLRLGSRAIGFDLGFLDRASLLGPPGGHAGISGSSRTGEGSVFPGAEVRYHAGLELANGLYPLWSGTNGLGLDKVLPLLGAGLELAPAGRVAFGFDLAGGPALTSSSGLFLQGGLHLRIRLGGGD